MRLQTPFRRPSTPPSDGVQTGYERPSNIFRRATHTYPTPLRGLRPRLRRGARLDQSATASAAGGLRSA